MCSALVIANVHTAGQWGRLQPGGGRAGATAGVGKTPGPFTRFWNNVNMWSCTEPPWGELVAVNANTGDIAWRVPLGEFEELTRKGVKPTGTPNSGGAITTAGKVAGDTLDVRGPGRQTVRGDRCQRWRVLWRANRRRSDRLLAAVAW